MSEQEIANVPLQFERDPHQKAPRTATEAVMQGENYSETRLAVQASTDRRTALEKEMDFLTDIDKPNIFENHPARMAYLLTKMPLAKGATLSIHEALAMWLTAVSEGANPFTGELYRTGPYRFATNVQAKINKLRRSGVPVGVPKFESTARPWPTGKKLTRYDYTTKREIAFDLDTDLGMICRLPIGKDVVEQTSWITNDYVATNANWWDRMDHMLQVRALGRCVTFGGGEGVSDQVGVDAPEDIKQVEEVDTPKIKVSK